MRISCCWLYAISKYGYPASLADTFKAIAEMAGLGFKYIELEGVREENLMEVYNNRGELKRRCRGLGLEVINFCPVLPDLVSLDAQRRQKAQELFKLGIELANFFGCPTIQIDSYTPWLEFAGAAPYKEMVDFGLQFRVIVDPEFDWAAQWAVLVDSIRICTQLAKSAGLKLCLEPRVGEMVSNTDALLRLMDGVSDENFGAVLDTGHFHAQKELLPLSVEKLGKRIFYVHVSDNDGKVNEHLGLGKGTVDWESVFSALLKHEFDGYVGIDIGRIPALDAEMVHSKGFLVDLFQRLNIRYEG